MVGERRRAEEIEDLAPLVRGSLPVGPGARAGASLGPATSLDGSKAPPMVWMRDPSVPQRPAERELGERRWTEKGWLIGSWGQGSGMNLRVAHC